jgi:allantoinase
MLPLFVKGLLDRGLPLTWAPRLTAANPARHFRIDHVKGALTVGRDADIAVLTPEPYVYSAAASGNNVVGWSPYDGMRLPWRVAATYLRGRQIFDAGRVLAEPGSGRFVRPPMVRPIAGAA